MSAQSHAITRKGLALVTAGMFAFSSMTLAPVAVAQNETAETEVSANLVSQLNTNDTAKLTIHKLKGGFVGTNQWGVQQDVAGIPLDGIAFDVYKIKDIDLSTIDGWKTYGELDPKKANEYATEANYVKTLTTANGGVASDTLPIGVYVVKENLSKSEPNPAGTYTPAAPFITALPFTNKEGTAWNKDVHVYPKNQELTSEKTVTDQGQHAQDTISYDLAGTIPPVPANHAGSYFDGYSLVDIYDPKKWTPNTGSIKVQVTDGAGTKVRELDAADFQVSTPVAYAKEEGKNAFTISLTRQGLNKVEAEAKKGTQLRLVATVDGQLKENLNPGELQNKMQVIPPNTSTPNWGRSDEPDDPNTPPEEPTPETEVESKYGKINITKVDSADPERTLEGAEFQLRKCENNNTAGGEGVLIKGSKPIKVNGTDKWTTDAEGKFTITGIQLEDWFDGEEQKDEFDYCLVETKAPQGYELLPKPVLVPVNQKTPSTEAQPFTLTSNVSNVKTTTGTFRLPSTGEWGRWWLVGLGVLAILAAAGVILANNRRNSA